MQRLDPPRLAERLLRWWLPSGVVGDSIIGHHVTLGAGTCTENHRHDGRNHSSMIQGELVDTGRTKLGAIIGDGVRTGVNTSLEAAIKIGVARTTEPGSVIKKDLM